MINPVDGNRLLKCLPEPDLALLARHFKVVPLAYGAVLHEPEAPIGTVYFPLSGAVSLLVVMKSGEAIEIASVGREGAVGFCPRPGSWQARTRAVVQVSGLAKSVPSTVLKTVLDQREHSRDLMYRFKGTIAAQCVRTAACNALHSVEQRVARWLLQMSDQIDNSEVPVTQTALSQMLGVQRTTVTCAAQRLQNDDLIRGHRGHVSILNRESLEAVACECYDAWREAEALFDQSILAPAISSHA
jgi:CRP-like cAMP-binding protein